jgi:hypothetical protein
MTRFIATVFLFALATPAFAQIKIENIKARHGHFGPERASLDVVPGDELVITYTVVGAQTDKAGVLNAEQEVKAVDPAGKVVLDKKVPIKHSLVFGGDRFPAYATLAFPLEAPAGEYKLTVTITDHLANKSASFERTINCVKATYSLVRPRFSYDKDGHSSASLTNICGQQVFFKLMAVHFDRSEKKIDMQMEIQVLDDKGKEMMLNPIKAKVLTEDPDVVKKNATVNFSGFFSCNRPGNFKLRVTVTDKVNKKTATFEAPIKVLE